MSSSVPLYKCPRRFLFIASIGNPAPYTGTRHSAGHTLLDVVQPYLHERIGLSFTSSSSVSKSAFYTAWKSPSLMNVSGPPVLRQLKTWLADRRAFFDTTFGKKAANTEAAAAVALGMIPLRLLKGPQGEPIDVDVRDMTHFRPTLVILHDELEAPPGKVKVRAGGPEQASLRGHRGLISIMESLRGAGLLKSQNNGTTMSILRIGIGIGRPTSREREAVADYVLSKLTSQDLKAIEDAAPQVVDLLVQEMYRGGDV